MRKIGLLPINWLAAKIWKKHSFKQLPNTFQQHFWQGGVGKWERYFNRMQLIFLKRCGIELLLEKYGYLEISERFKSVTQDITEEECQQMYPDSYFTQRNICVYGNETSSTHQFLLKQHGSNSCNQNDEFSFVSHNTKIKDELAAIFDNFYVKQIAKAGAYSAFGNERIALNIKS